MLEQDAYEKMMKRISVQTRELTQDEAAAYTLIKAKAVELAVLIENVPLQFAFDVAEIKDPVKATVMHERMFAKTQEAQRAIVHLQDVVFRAQRAIDV